MIHPVSAAERRKILLNMIRDKGEITFVECSDAFNVSIMTARRDIGTLAREGYVDLIAKGAALRRGRHIESIEEISTPDSMRAKKAIAKSAIPLIDNHSTVILDFGTAIMALAEELSQSHLELIVGTTSIAAAMKLSHNTGIRTLVPEGVLLPADYHVIGSATEKFISGHRWDYAIMSTGGITKDGKLSDLDIDECRIKQAMIESADNVIILAEQFKIGRESFAQVGWLKPNFDIITDIDKNNQIISQIATISPHIHYVSPEKA